MVVISNTTLHYTTLHSFPIPLPPQILGTHYTRTLLCKLKKEKGIMERQNFQFMQPNLTASSYSTFPLVTFVPFDYCWCSYSIPHLNDTPRG